MFILIFIFPQFTKSKKRMVGNFSDGYPALMLDCVWLHHVAGTQWGNKKYMNMKHLKVAFRTPPLTWASVSV